VSLFRSLVSFEDVTLERANDLLLEWGHKMGALKRGNQGSLCYALFHNDSPVALTTTSTLIQPTLAVSGGLYTRENTLELSRLCASRPGLCRVALRLWREFVFPKLGYEFACSYQDADLHNGNTYRFDGWKRVGFSHSGVDTRSRRPGRDKWIWVWTKQDAA